ncbi:MAG TPA: polysaccharide biosynthesis/export family protein [Candidatus Acidoferrum sp.]|nr:polysaccharide biosynthesis/export family protein [Candidatus Acidoferrum sp.]
MAVKVRGVSGLLRPGFLIVAALVGVTLLPRIAFGRQTVQTPQQTNEKILQLASRARTEPVDIPIGAGDLVHVDVFDVPDLSRDVRVSQTGDITFPLLPGLIHVAGLDVFQLQNKMAQLLIENGLVSHPQVSVFVKEQNSQPISIVGAVRHPMVYQAVRPTTLLQVLAEAGGIGDDAGGDVIITRPADPTPQTDAPKASSTDPDPPADPPGGDPPAEPEVITVHLQDLLDSGISKDIPVEGGDVIRVPQAGIVYVLGAGISQPGGYVLQGHGQNVTILRAVALAHGLTGFAKADSSVILRTNPVTGKREEIHVRIKQIEKNKAPDVPVLSNDILYIPDSAGKKALARAGESAIGIGTSVAIYRVAY